MPTRIILMLMPALFMLNACVAPTPTPPQGVARPELPLRTDPLPAAVPAPAASQSPLTAGQIELLADLKSQGPAPELLNDIWINTEPLQLADLRGKVVIVEFWTYG